MAPKPELVRFAAVRDRDKTSLAIADRRGVLPGRGAYLCVGSEPGIPAADCLELARKRGGMARALRCSVRISPELVESVDR